MIPCHSERIAYLVNLAETNNYSEKCITFIQNMDETFSKYVYTCCKNRETMYKHFRKEQIE